MKRKTIKVQNPNNLPTLKYTDIEDFQGDLKTITEADKEKLARLILELDFFKSKTVFVLNEKYYMADGHQTKAALEYLETIGIDGVKYEIPEIPVEFIPVKTRKEAAKKLLALNSQFGKLNEKTSFFSTFNFSVEEIGKFSFDSTFKGFNDFKFEVPNLNKVETISTEPVEENSEIEDIPDISKSDIEINDSDESLINNPVSNNYSIRYELIFDNEEQQDTFYKFLKYLKDTYPNSDTIAARITDFINERNILQ